MKGTTEIVMTPNSKCKVCLGRGWVRYRIPDNNSKEIRPCSCVRVKVKDWPSVDVETITDFKILVKEKSAI